MYWALSRDVWIASACQAIPPQLPGLGSRLHLLLICSFFLNAFDSTWCNLSSRCSDLDIVILVPGMVVNIIMSSASLRTGESWTPVCLSQYNDKAQIGTEHSDSHTMGTKQLWSGNLFRIFAVQHHYSMQGFAYAYISCIEGTDFGTAEAFEHSVREAVGTICHKICHTICHSYRF